MTEYPLYVPIMVDALVYGDNSPHVADASPDYGRLDVNPPFGLSAVNRPFTTINEKSGVHLHWTMPDALLYGVENEDRTGMVFPRLPNRWLVQRLWQEGKQLRQKAWLVRSDAISYETAYTENGMYKTTFPSFHYEKGLWVGKGEEDYIYCFLGGWEEYAGDRNISEDRDVLERLTATGAGDMAFASYYPNCKTVFGFYDDLKGLGSGSFTYLVTGYYEPGEQDPLCDTRRTFQELLDDYHWTCPKQPGRPDGMVCHGTVKNVPWKGPRAFYPSGAPAEEVEAAVGNTSAEALSVLLQSRFPDIKGLERIFNALQYHQLQEFDNPSDPDALIGLEEALHAHGFSSGEGGDMWILQDEEPAGNENLGEEIYGLLEELNRLQRDTDRRRQVLQSLKAEIYFSWWKFVKIQYEDAARTDGEPLLGLTRRLLDAGDEQMKTIVDQEAQIGRLAKELEGLLAPMKLKAVKVKEGAYYTPSPPAILLAGDGLKRGFYQGFQTDDQGNLPCRRKALNRLCVDTGRENVELRLEDVLKDRAASCLPDALGPILMEGILLNREFAGCLAAAALKKAGVKPVKERMEQVKRAVEEKQEQLKRSPEAPFPDSDREWKQPWYPMFLHWSITLEAARTSVYKDDSFAQFTLGEVDFEWKDKERLEKGREFEGSTMISPHAVTNMYHAINRLIEDYGEDGKHYRQLKQAAAVLLNMDILSQSLAGFQEALIMRDDKLFLPPYYPLDEDEDEIREILLRVTRQLKSYQISPRDDFFDERFLPVRAGRVRLNRLWIVDAFGQIKEVSLENKRIHIAESVERGGDILLPPRFLQPAACRFWWLSFENEDREASDQYTTPVFGYLIPDFLDRNLHVYDSVGVLLGFLQVSSSGARWVENPARPMEPEAIRPLHLKLLVKRLLRAGSRALEALLSCLEKRLDYSAPDSPGTFKSLCFGPVAALARAAVDVTGKGLPPYAQQLNDRLESHGLDEEAVGIMLGDCRRQGDGVIGFFEGGPEESTYELFHPSMPSGPGEWLSGDTQVHMSLKDGPRRLTLLLEPGGRVTVRCGFLPAAGYVLPARLFQPPIERMEVMLRIAPLLTDRGVIQLPVPGGLEEEWEFLYRDEEKSLRTNRRIEPPDQLLPARRKAALEGFLKTNMKGG